jgi:glutathione synthase/RimK-type ligase-like ATP-grasp enzyme
MKGIDVVCQYLYIWPPVNQVNDIGSKRRLMQHLTNIAATLKMIRPVTKVVTSRTNIPNNVVLKRSHSDAGQHVLMPNEQGRDWESLRLQMEIPGCVWMGQTLVPQLNDIGEWRVFLVGGRIVYCVHTRYNRVKRTWKWEPVMEYYSLDELTYVLSLLIMS